MVAQLHQRGYQRLRVVPALSPSGVHWRCMITPSSNTQQTHGGHLAALDQGDSTVVTYSSAGPGDEYFGWSDRKQAGADLLADTFLERFPQLCSQGLGYDQEYAKWFGDLLEVVDAGWFPYFYADWSIDESAGLALTRLGGTAIGYESMPTLRLPPPGKG